MVFEVVLGFNIDTNAIICSIKSNSKNNVIVLIYDYDGKPFKKNSVWYFSSKDLKKLINKGQCVKFHKTLFGLPGMSGNMSLLYKKSEKESDY